MSPESAGRPVRASAPTRVDLAGGTLDIWPLYLLHPGALTVNLAVSLRAEAEVEPLPGRAVVLRSEDRGSEVQADAPGALEPGSPLRLLMDSVVHLAPAGGLRLRTRCASPAGAGLGGSSALAVAVCAALSRFSGAALGSGPLLDTAMGIETALLGFPTGRQDYYPAIHGGLLALHWEVAGPRVERLPVDLGWLASHLVLAYTGDPHESGVRNWDVFKARIERHDGVSERLEAIARSAVAMRAALLSGDAARIAAALRDEWDMRRGLAPTISTPRIDALARAAERAGAAASKVCGAGGGGCVLYFVGPGRRAAVVRALRSEGAEILEAEPDAKGLLVS